MAMVLFRLRQIVIIVLFVCCGVLVFNSFNLMKDHDLEPPKADFGVEDLSLIKMEVLHSDRDITKKNGSVNVKTNTLTGVETCNIPKLDINGSEVIGFFKKHEPLNCQKPDSGIEDNWVFVDNDGLLKFTEKRKGAVCKIRYVDRVDDNRNSISTPVKIYDGFVMNVSDYAVIHCVQRFEKWKSILWTIVDNKKVREMKRELASNRGNKKPMNVYFLGFDSLSQMSFRRKLPKTVDYLEKVMGSVVLNGYNIVGDGTPQAFIPILTAQTETELPLTRKRYSNANYVDDVYPFIWNNFSDAGYVTMYGEDAFNIGTFTYRLKGFRKLPTDHYTRTIFQEIEKLNDRNCIGSIPLHKMWFQNARRFMKVYEDVPRFLLMHQSLLSHDDINLVGVEDDDLSSHLKLMNEEGHFDNSIVIVMADHGHRFAQLRGTHQGQLEERMPFFSIYLPKSFRHTDVGKTMYKNLLDNKEKLTSPFDIHATLMDILNLNDNEDSFTEPQGTERSQSLFRPISSNRVCSEAGIEPHWCTCLSWQDAMSTDEDRNLSMRIAQTVVAAINREIETEKKLCAPLRLDKLIGSKKLLPDKGLLSYKNTKDADGFVPDLSGNTKPAFAHYQIKFKTTPGVAIYEATLFYDMMKDEVKFDFASLSHVNKFGDTPHCIIDKNYYLATFCVCYDRI
ncbi:unnamed protein product [Caenorhabditis bovis]|uniref:DUF229 domain-containing protein n=1 Tax=Caenorhabditis bovis TaxID=2654633 RepID=A0A8S1FC14_9PELO|nr:unnamed protein product [Caenorhabditis bovis]